MSIFSDIWHSVKGDAHKKKKKNEDVQNEKIGNVSLNAGDHGTIFGFNRNIIVGTGIGIFTITAIATIFAMDTADDSSARRVSERQQQASTAQDGKHEAGKIHANSYEDLAKSEANFLGQNSNNNQVGRGNGTPQQRPQQTPQTSQLQPPASTPPSGYSPLAVPTPVAVESEDDREEREYMQRMRSGITFALSGSAVSKPSEHGQQSTNNNGSYGNFTGNPTGQDGMMQDSSNSSYVASPQSNMTAFSEVSYVAPGKYTLQAGTIIPVVLCTGINSDIGGQVVAQVQQDMYDSATGRNLLIPAGSKILGTYGKGSPNNSGRVEISFNTIVLPDGGSFSVGGALVAVDGAGYAGVSGKVHRHTGSMLSAGMFSSALAALGSVAAGNTSNTSNTYSAGQLAMQGAMANLMNSASSLFQQGTNRQMTVTAAPGASFSVYVTQGITLKRGRR